MLEIMQGMAYPDTPHDWNKYFKGYKKKRSKKENDAPKLTECPECFTVYASELDECLIADIK